MAQITPLTRELDISIHALREEGDRVRRQPARPDRISIHALREEGDEKSTLKMQEMQLFLSTPSARRATVTNTRSFLHNIYFYPRPPRGGRPVGGGEKILILLFLSTPSARRVTI